MRRHVFLSAAFAVMLALTVTQLVGMPTGVAKRNTEPRWIAVELQALPHAPHQQAFSGPLGHFHLDDDGVTECPNVFAAHIPEPLPALITMDHHAGWRLNDIVCTGEATVTIDVVAHSVSIESVAMMPTHTVETCTFFVEKTQE